MTNYVVLKTFIDKETQQQYVKGSTYSPSNEERASHLESGGYIAHEESQMAKTQQQNQTNVQTNNQMDNQYKTVVNGQEVDVKQAQQMQEQFEAQNNQTGIQAHHDNSSEHVQAGQTAQNTQAKARAKKEVNQVNVQSGQSHLSQQAGQQAQTQQQGEVNQEYLNLKGNANAKTKKVE